MDGWREDFWAHIQASYPDFVPEDDDITLIYNGQHYDVLELRIPAGQHAWWGRHARGVPCDLLDDGWNNE